MHSKQARFVIMFCLTLIFWSIGYAAPTNCLTQFVNDFGNSKCNFVMFERKDGQWTLTTLCLNADMIARFKRLKDFQNLSGLMVRESSIADLGLNELVGLESLRVLSLSCNYGVTDKGLDTLSKVKNLRILDLSGTRINQTNLCKLKNIPQLEELNIEGTVCPTSTTSKSILDWTCLTNLKKLTMNIYPGHTPEILAPINLQELSVTISGDGGILPQWIRNVHCLNISCHFSTNSVTGFTLLNTFTNINELQIKLMTDDMPSPQEFLIVMPLLSRMSRITSLTIDCYDDTKMDEWAKCVSGNNSLQHLKLQGGCMNGKGISGVGLKYISNLRQLRGLEIDSSDTGDLTGINELQNLTELRRLNWSIPTIELSFLPHLKKLESISLRYIAEVCPGVSGCPTFDAVLSYLQGMDQLEEVNVPYISDKGLEMLSKLKRLRRIKLNGNSGYTDADLAKLMDESPSLQTVMLIYWPEKKGE